MFWLKSIYSLLKIAGYRKIVYSLAAVVVFITTYLLVLPAITLEQSVAEQQSGIALSGETLLTEQNHADLVKLEDDQPEDVTLNDPTPPPENFSSKEVLEDDQSQEVTDERVLFYQGEDYSVKAQFNRAAQLPADVELRVIELEIDSASYKEHIQRAQDYLVNEPIAQARFFDISFHYQGQEISPQAGVTIVIDYSEELIVEDKEKLHVLHYDEINQAESLEATSQQEGDKISEISFVSAEFSVFGLVTTGERRSSELSHYEIRFKYLDNNQNEHEIINYVEAKDGAQIGNLPEPPYRSGYRFRHWKQKGTNQIVTETTPVTQNMELEAVFEEITIYTVTINYYYYNNQKATEVVFDTDSFQVEETDIPRQITPPVSIQVSKGDDATLKADATYYPERPLVEIKKDSLGVLDKGDGTEDRQVTIKVKYAPHTAEFDYVYMLKDLVGTGYSEIRTLRGYGALGSTVSPQILDFEFAELERAGQVEIRQAKGQRLYVYYRRKHYSLSYEPNGGSYLSPKTGLYNENIPLSLTVPTRVGYDFVGWHEKSDLSDPAKKTGSIILNRDKVLYASWKPKNVAYTIVYLKEIYDNTTQSTRFEYTQSHSATGLVGTRMTANQAPAINLGTYYQVDSQRNAASTMEIAPDGSSVLKVYYRLKRYTIIFNLNNNWSWISIGGKTYTGRNYRLSNVVLGQDISSQWPSSTEEVNSYSYNSNFTGWLHPARVNIYSSRRFEITSDMLDRATNNIIEYTAQWSQRVVFTTLEYYLQSATNPSIYERSQTYSQSLYREYNSGFGAKQLDGFTVRNTTPSGYYGSYGNTFRFYYDRNRYKIDYFHGQTKLGTHSNIYFDARIDNTSYNYVPQRPATIDADYTWDGWYVDSAFQTKYTFNRMPPHDVVLYARWIPPNYTVRFHANGGSGQFSSQTVEKYKGINYPGTPTRRYFDFIGWYTEANGGEPYDWSKPVTKNMTLYARWKPVPLSYTVRYLEEGTAIPLAAEKQVSNPALVKGQTVSEKAVAITGYRPDEQTNSVILDDENSIIEFYYSKKSTPIRYTIKYVLADNEAIEVAPTQVKEVSGSVLFIKEKALAVDQGHLSRQRGINPEWLNKEYYATQDVIGITLSSKSVNNVIVFKYRPYDVTQITMNYLDMDGRPIAGQTPLEITRKKPSYFNVVPKEINGYSFAASRDNEGKENQFIYSVTAGKAITINLYYKKNINLAAVDKTKVYDGRPLNSSGLMDLDTRYQADLEAGDQLTQIQYQGSQMTAGIGVTRPDAAKITQAGRDRTYYYALHYQSARLVIQQQPVTIRIIGDQKNKVYDGQQHTIGYRATIEDSSGLYKESDFQFNGTNADKTLVAKDAGQYELRLADRFTNKNQNFAVTFSVSDARLNITPRRIILTSQDAEKSFDNSPLVNREIRITSPEHVGYSGMVSGESLIYQVTGTQTQPGSTENRFSYTAGRRTKLSNYEITPVFGTLKVLPRVNLQKVNEAWSPLRGGSFRITKYSATGWQLVTQVDIVEHVSSDGILLPGLRAGLYRIEEVSAPDGYIVLDKYLYFKLTEEITTPSVFADTDFTLQLTDDRGQPVSIPHARTQSGTSSFNYRIQVANKPGRALPHTGGMGPTVFYIGGILSILSGITYVWLGRRNQSRGG